MVLCLGEPPESVRVVGCCCCCFPQCSFFTFPGYFSLPSVLHHAFSGQWRPPPALNSILATFGCFAFSQAFPSQFYRERYGFERAFFTHRRFLSSTSSTHFWHTLWLRFVQEHLIQVLLCACPPRVVPSSWHMDLNNSYCIHKTVNLSIASVSTKYRVKIKLLNMFRLFKVIWKDYQNTLNKTW